MTDMTNDIARLQSVQQSSVSAKTSAKSESAEGQSFSETLESVVNESSRPQAAQAQEQAAETEGAENGSMLMAEAMAAVPLNLLLPVMNGEEVETALEVQPALNADAAALPVIAQAPAASVPAESLMQAAVAQNPNAALSQQQQQTGGLPMIEVTITENTAANNGEAVKQAPSDILQGQTEFQKSVEMAQRLLRSTDGGSSRSKPLEIDVEELQRKVDSREYLNAAQAAATAQADGTSQPQQVKADYQQPQTIDSKDVFEQIKASADAHVRQGDSEFTIKLRPEGLGEITVKLLSQDGRITLSLAANDVNVQRLLSAEIGNLRDVMRPYNVEVSQVVESNEAAMADLQQQLQQHSQQQLPGRQQRAAFAATAVEQPGFPDMEEVQPAQPKSALDAYI